MIHDEMIDALEGIDGLHVLRDEPAARHCLLRVGGRLALAI